MLGRGRRALATLVVTLSWEVIGWLISNVNRIWPYISEKGHSSCYIVIRLNIEAGVAIERLVNSLLLLLLQSK